MVEAAVFAQREGHDVFPPLALDVVETGGSRVADRIGGIEVAPERRDGVAGERAERGERRDGAVAGKAPHVRLYFTRWTLQQIPRLLIGGGEAVTELVRIDALQPLQIGLPISRVAFPARRMPSRLGNGCHGQQSGH